MQPLSDAQLLREYAEHGAETAFAEIVARHTNLVYSAALRQVDSPDIAAEVAQGAFIGLARGARSLSQKLAESASLAGWLCRSARNISLNLRRDEFRRHSRERQAMENLDSIPEATPEWERLRPVLDEAMSELSEPDYDALLLRFFKNQDLRSVGLALGVSDDAAQKRVSRALDKLRNLLAQRGIRTSATALSIILSANAVQAAPAGLAAAISTATALAGTTIATTATASATKAITMTTLQKTVVGATLVAAIGTGVYEAHQSSNLRTQVQSLVRQQAPLTERIEQMSRERNEVGRQLVALRDENERLNRNTGELPKLRGEVARLRANAEELAELKAAAKDPFVDTALDWKAKAAQLRELMEQRPNQKIPELQLVSDRIWLSVAQDASLDTETGIRKALSRLRFIAENNFANMLSKALQEHAKANNGQFPGDISQLKPYFGWSVDDAMLKRYEILPTDANDFPPERSLGGRWVITQKTSVDAEHDSRWIIGNGTFGPISFQTFDEEKALAPYVRALDRVKEAFSAANNGQQPTDPSQLAPYLRTPEEQSALQKVLQARKPAAK